MISDKFFNLATEVIQIKEQEKQEKAQRLLTENQNNTLFCYETYILNGIELSAKNGEYERTVHLVKNNRGTGGYNLVAAKDYENCKYSSQYFNTRLNMFQNLPTIQKAFCDFNTLLTILQNNGFKYEYETKPFALSRTGKSYINNCYIDLTIYWGKDLSWHKKTKEEILQESQVKINEILHKNDIQCNTKIKKVTPGLRYDILKRDGFKCQLCGRKPTKDNDVTLEVDHIIPVSKGGLTIPENLRCLCRDCNRGKSNKLEN